MGDVVQYGYGFFQGQTGGFNGFPFRSSPINGVLPEGFGKLFPIELTHIRCHEWYWKVKTWQLNFSASIHVPFHFGWTYDINVSGSRTIKNGRRGNSDLYPENMVLRERDFCIGKPTFTGGFYTEPINQYELSWDYEVEASYTIPDEEGNYPPDITIRGRIDVLFDLSYSFNGYFPLGENKAKPYFRINIGRSGNDFWGGWSTTGDYAIAGTGSIDGKTFTLKSFWKGDEYDEPPYDPEFPDYVYVKVWELAELRSVSLSINPTEYWPYADID
jgi:hypothetical protein